MIIKYSKDRRDKEILWHASLMYSDKDYFLSSISRISKKQAKLNVMARYRRRSKSNLFLSHFLLSHKREVINRDFVER